MDKCFCNICTVARDGDPRCDGKVKHILVTALDQPDATNSPNLWRTQWRGSTILPVKFFTGTPTAGTTYVAHLMCASGEYVTWLPAVGGSLWVLYSNENLYLVELPSTATLYSNWSTKALNSEFLALGIEQSEKLVIAENSSDDIYYSADTAASWSSVQSASRSLSDVRFDHTLADVGYTVDRPNTTLTTAEETALAASIGTLSNQNYTPANVHANYTSFLANIQPIVVYDTADGGATWSSTTLGYTGAVIPSRIGGSEYITQFMESVTNGLCGWDAFSDVCGWETNGDIPPLGSNPCMAGAITFINQSGNPRDIAITRNTDGTVNQYAVCDATDATDKDNLTFFQPSPSQPLIAPKHDAAGGYYVAQPATYRDTDFNGGFGVDDKISPFIYWTSISLDLLRRTAIINQAGTSWAIDPGDLAGTATELISVDIQVDKTNADRIFAISNQYYVYRLLFATEAITDISPTASGNVYTMSESWVTADGTLLLPMAWYDDPDDKFGVWRSTDQGDSWVFTDLTSASTDIFSETCRIAQSTDSNSTLFMAHIGGKVSYSTDDGATWTTSADITGESGSVQDVAAS